MKEISSSLSGFFVSMAIQLQSTESGFQRSSPRNWIKKDYVEGSLSKTLKEVYHLKIDRRENVIEAVRPSVSDIELLKITYDTLILQITSKSFLKDNVPYEYSVTSWIGDAIRLEVDVEDIEHGITFLK